MLKPQPYILKSTIQHYDWGTRGKNAFIPKLLNIKSERDKPYAELWMGAHPKSPSKIIVDGKGFNLDEVVRQYPKEMLGSKTVKRFSNILPFLFKVLSANEALSIQAHPNKKQAIALHKKDPLNYPDNNQKLEIAIALDSLTALVGFKPFDQIIKTLKNYPEVKKYIGERFINSMIIKNLKTVKTVDQTILNIVLSGITPAENGKRNAIINRFNGLPSNLLSSENQKKFVKRVFEQLIIKSVSEVEGLNTAIKKLYHRISKKKEQSEIEKHFIKLFGKYKNDVGLLILFFLNLVHLKRGEAIFTKPGVPHAYLKGNILECMSNSDNVIRAGLTPKFKDLNNLLRVLTFELGSPRILKGIKKGNFIIYKTDAKEFEVKRFDLRKEEIIFENQSSPKILLVLKGVIKISFKNDNKFEPAKLSKGNSIFLPSILSNFKINSENASQFIIVSVP